MSANVTHCSTGPDAPVACILLLCEDTAWVAAAQHVAGEAGATLVCAASATDALYRLVEPSHRITLLLLQPRAGGALVRDLLGMTADESGSQVGVVLLGEAGGVPAGRSIRHAPAPGDLAGAVRTAPAKSAGSPALSTSDVAVTFDSRNIECRFQPIVRLSDRSPAGMEALVRLQHGQLGTIGPDHFVPQIERAGLSLRLTEGVVSSAMASVDAALLEQHDLFVSINLPLDVLLFPEATERIDAHRTAHAIPAERILVELTESRPVDDFTGLARALEGWRKAGYRVAIDDMGPEMTNQAELFDLPFNMVKLDKQVVLRSQTDGSARSYLQRTVSSAKTRSLQVIAEGIETQAMWRDIRALEVDFAQGFLVARALPATALPIWLEAWSKQLALPRDRDPG